MNTDFSRKLDTFDRVLGHCEEFPDGSTGFTSLVDGLRQDRDRAWALAMQQRDGLLDTKAATSRKSKLRARVHHHFLVPVARIAGLAAEEEPELDKLFRLPRVNSRTVVWRTAARSMVAAVGTRKELFLRHGMTEALFTDLVSALDEFDGSTSRSNSSRGAHVTATAEMIEVIRDGMRKVDVLDGLNLYRFRDDPEKLAYWESAKNVPTPAIGKAAPPSAEPPVATAA